MIPAPERSEPVNEYVRVLTSENWGREVLQSDLPVLVDFSAEWCPPCRLIEPTIESLAKEFAGRVRVGKVDVDASSDVAERYGVHSMPTLLVLRDGRVVDQRIGAAPPHVLRDFLAAHVGLVAAPR